MNLQQKAEMLGSNTFLGVPAQHFEKRGRECFITLLQAGLNPDTKLVEIGCGVLRIGYWLIHFLDPEGYCGIEPHTGRLQMGTGTILEPDVHAAKRPRFDTNARFDTSVFGEKFDMFLAYSIWTHASKQQIRTMLDSFIRDAKDDGIFLTTYLPASWNHSDYMADEWFGTSHESDTQGCIHHSRRWIRAECDRRGLAMREMGRDKIHGQTWLEIKRR